MSLTDPRRTPALEIGGSHVSAGLTDTVAVGLHPGTRHRTALPHGEDPHMILDAWIATARQLGAPGQLWGVAIPGPFDYRHGVGDFTGVGKFEALSGVDIGSALTSGIGPGTTIRFVNDADAFAVGAWLSLPRPRPARTVGITLGTGVGTGFVATGKIVTAGAEVPPQGNAHLLQIDGRPLEETASTRAVLATYQELTGQRASTVEEIAHLARSGSEPARTVFQDAWTSCAQALAPYLLAFGATHVVVGGSVANAWDLVKPALRAGMDAHCAGLSERLVLLRSADTEAAGLLGAARFALT